MYRILAIVLSTLGILAWASTATAGHRPGTITSDTSAAAAGDTVTLTATEYALGIGGTMTLTCQTPYQFVSFSAKNLSFVAGPEGTYTATATFPLASHPDDYSCTAQTKWRLAPRGHSRLGGSLTFGVDGTGIAVMPGGGGGGDD